MSTLYEHVLQTAKLLPEIQLEIMSSGAEDTCVHLAQNQFLTNPAFLKFKERFPYQMGRELYNMISGCPPAFVDMTTDELLATYQHLRCISPNETWFTNALGAILYSNQDLAVQILAGSPKVDSLAPKGYAALLVAALKQPEFATLNFNLAATWKQVKELTCPRVEDEIEQMLKMKILLVRNLYGTRKGFKFKQRLFVNPLKAPELQHGAFSKVDDVTQVETLANLFSQMPGVLNFQAGQELLFADFLNNPLLSEADVEKLKPLIDATGFYVLASVVNSTSLAAKSVLARRPAFETIELFSSATDWRIALDLLASGFESSVPDLVVAVNALQA